MTGDIFYGICVPRADGIPPKEEKLITDERGSLEIYCTPKEAHDLANKINKEYNQPGLFQVFEINLRVVKRHMEKGQ